MKKFLWLMILVLIPLVAADYDLECVWSDGDMWPDCADDWQGIAWFWDEDCSAPAGGGPAHCGYNWGTVDRGGEDGRICCHIQNETVTTICDENNVTGHHMLNINKTPQNPEHRDRAWNTNIPGGYPACIGSVLHKVSCDYVNNTDTDNLLCEDICSDAGHETCVATFNWQQPDGNYNQKVSFCSEDTAEFTDSETCICCSADDDEIFYGDGYFDRVSITPFCNESVGTIEEWCEIGEVIQAEITYVPIAWPGTVWVQAVSNDSDCTIMKDNGAS